MSDFDKEKEREKLRRKFEREEERRQSTEQMSELLLKGATMLNVHCQECASPIFRHEGREFCPTCGRSVDELQMAGDPSALETDTEAVEPAVSDGQQPPAPEQRPAEPTQQQPADPAEQPADQPEPQPTTEQPEPAPQPVERPAVELPDDAGEALSGTIAALAERAAAAEDPRRAREYLDAAHQAAETLAMLSGRQ